MSSTLKRNLAAKKNAWSTSPAVLERLSLVATQGISVGCVQAHVSVAQCAKGLHKLTLNARVPVPGHAMEVVMEPTSKVSAPDAVKALAVGHVNSRQTQKSTAGLA